MHYGDVLGNPKYFIIINYILIIIFVLIEAEFLEIKTESGHSISLTHNHLIYEKTKGYLKAEFIKLEDELQVLMNNNGSVAFSKILSIEEKIEAGYIAPLVESGQLLVDGIHASCYADVNSHMLAHLALKPLIYWYKFSKYMGFEHTDLKHLQKKQDYLDPYVAMFNHHEIKNMVNLLS